MKKLLICIVLWMLALPVLAGLPCRKFSAGINYTSPVGSVGPAILWNHIPGLHYNHLESYNRYWGVGLEVSYRLPIYRMFQFNPSLSVGYSRHHEFETVTVGGWNPWGDKEPKPNDIHGNMDQLELDVCLPVGMKLNFPHSSIDVGTGPVFGSYLYQKNKSYCDGFSKTEKNITKRFRSYWRFYARYNFLNERIYAKVSFDIGISHYLTNLDLRNQMVFGVGMNF